jgi:hypothetical protein
MTAVCGVLVSACYLGLLIRWPNRGGLDRRGAANARGLPQTRRGSIAEQLSPRPRRSNPTLTQSTEADGDHASSHPVRLR